MGAAAEEGGLGSYAQLADAYAALGSLLDVKVGWGRLQCVVVRVCCRQGAQQAAARSWRLWAAGLLVPMGCCAAMLLGWAGLGWDAPYDRGQRVRACARVCVYVCVCARVCVCVYVPLTQSLCAAPCSVLALAPASVTHTEAKWHST